MEQIVDDPRAALLQEDVSLLGRIVLGNRPEPGFRPGGFMIMGDGAGDER